MIYKSCAKKIADMIVSSPTHKYRIQTDDRGSYVGEINLALACVFSDFKDYEIYCKTEERAEYELASKIARFLIKDYYTSLKPKRLHEAVVDALEEVGIDAKPSINVGHRENFAELDKISRYSIVGAIDARMARKKEYTELHRSPIEKRLDRIIELLERSLDPKEVGRIQKEVDASKAMEETRIRGEATKVLLPHHYYPPEPNLKDGDND